MSSPSLLRPLALALTALLCACGDSGPQAGRVVVFTVDTLRADQLSPYGNRAYATPNAERLARQSLVFDAAYSQATITHPSLSSMLTGLLPRRHGVHGQSGMLAEGVVPLPVLLDNQDIPTASFVANLCRLQPSPRTVFGSGWDLAHCGMDDALDQYHWDTNVVDEALAWIAEQDGPYFAWIHLMDPHAEHRPHPELWDYEADPPREKFEQYHHFNSWEEERSMPPRDELVRMWELYAAEVRGADRELGRVLDALEAREDWDETAVLFSADHGEELYETWSRFDHGFSLTEGVVWVPLMARVPGLEPGRFDEPVELLQMTPTVLELFDVAPPYAFDGPSLLSDAPSRGFAQSGMGVIATTIRTKEHRYWFRHTRQPWRRPPDQAPHRADARWFLEQHCLAEYPGPSRTQPRWMRPDAPVNAALVGELGARMQERLESLGKLPTPEEIDDPGLRDFLANLGYADTSGLGTEEDELDDAEELAPDED